VKRLICLFLTATSLFAQSPPSAATGPVFDPQGRLIAYVYPDGKTETCSYDAQWRMITFRDRNGKFTAFHYPSDHSAKPSQPKP
jgi:YD repeat-containing protein